MTQDIFRQDAYQQTCSARIVAVTPEGVVLDRTVFYPLGGGQAGDAGWLVLPDGSEVAISDTRKCKDAEGKPTDDILHVFASTMGHQTNEIEREKLSKLERLKTQNTAITARIDWPRRHRLMRFHTATHLLCHIVPQLVNGCSITPDYARLDFNMTDPLDKDALTQAIAQLVAAAHPVTVGEITDAQLDANPALVKSMSVSPPRGSGVVRTIRIGPATATVDAMTNTNAEQTETQELIDLQPCGGTHVSNTSEIGRVVVTKIEKKSATTRRVVLGFAP
jgi:misacylated tRNA(Ala) deacylase